MDDQHQPHPAETTADAIRSPDEPPRAAVTDDAMTDGHDDAPSSHHAETVQIDLAPYSLTREQVAERYANAGFQVKPRTVSLYAKEGRLRARKVEARNGLERYVFDPASVDEDIARRKRDTDAYANPETLYAAPADGAERSPEHGANGAAHLPAVSVQGEIYQREIRIAVLETELRMERDARVRAERRADQENGRVLALAQQIGEYKHRVAALEAPKEEEPPEPAGKNDARTGASFLRRLFGRG